MRGRTGHGVPRHRHSPPWDGQALLGLHRCPCPGGHKLRVRNDAGRAAAAGTVFAGAVSARGPAPTVVVPARRGRVCLSLSGDFGALRVRRV